MEPVVDQFAALTAAIDRLAVAMTESKACVPVEVVDVAGVAGMLGVTAKTVRKMDRRGELPEPILIGSRRKWRVAELRRWLAAGAPGRERWQTTKHRP